MTSQAIINRQIVQADAMTIKSYKLDSDLTNRINKARLILNSQLTIDETEQLDIDLTDKSPSKQREILSAWYDYKEDTNIFTAAKLRVTALKAWDGSTIWINERKNDQNVFLWKDRDGNIMLEWQKLDSRGLREQGQTVRVGYLIPGAIVDPWCFSLTPEEYDNWAARCNGRAPSLPKRKLEGGSLASESEWNRGERRYG